MKKIFNLFNFSFLKKKSAAEKRIYGWKPDLPDHRDFLFQIKRPIDLPSNVDLRPKDMPVFDQGQLGSCTANAISAAYAFDMRKQVEDEIFTPSRLFIYYNEREMEGTIPYDNGAMIRDGIKTINKIGVCDEKMWEYDINKFTVKPLNECYVQAGRNKAVQYQRLNNSENELKTCLALGLPFVFGFTVYESFESRTVAKTGKMPMPTKKEKSMGGHAVMAVGYDDSTKCFIIRNSWSDKWGDKGYFYMPYDFITDSDFCADFWVVQKVS